MKLSSLCATALAIAAVPAMAQPASSGAAQPAASASATPSGPVPVSRSDFIATMDAEFKRIDADKNNVLTRTEIEQWQRVVAVAQAQANNRALFTRLDTDRNGYISPTEFSSLQTPTPAPNAAPLLGQTDFNKDGSVTLVEYRAGKLVNFDQIDTDRDGVVSIAEMKAAGIIK